MLIPSIDLLGGQAVQLVGGKELELEAGDPRPIAEKFRLAGELAVIDLDAALSRGSNAALIEALCRIAPCRVGGGIRDAKTALEWLDRGASKVILGTRAVPEVLSQLPKERVIAALDAVNGEVVVEGWTTKTGESVLDRMAALRELVGGFLVTFVEREGRLGGTNLEQVPKLVAAARPAKLTIAGGVTTAKDVAFIDLCGADAQVGMAIYTGRLSLADAIAAPLAAEVPAGPWPTIICDRRGLVLAFAWSTPETLARSVATQRVHASFIGAFAGQLAMDDLELLRIDRDNTRRALRFVTDGEGRARYTPGAGGPVAITDDAGEDRPSAEMILFGPKHSGFGQRNGLSALEATLAGRKLEAPAGSYSRRLFDDPPLLRAKLIEEAGELADATERAHVIEEAADVAYFSSVALARAGASWADVEAALDRRALGVTRRKGDAKKDGGS